MATELKIGVLYIHTTYLDNIKNLDPSFIREAEECKKYDPVRYARDFEGKWINEDERALLSKELLNLAIYDTIHPVKFDQIVIAIDPAVTVHKDSDETRYSCMSEK